MSATRRPYVPLVVFSVLTGAFGCVAFGLIAGDWFFGAWFGVLISLMSRWTSSLFGSTDRYERESIARHQDVGPADDPDRAV